MDDWIAGITFIAIGIWFIVLRRIGAELIRRINLATTQNAFSQKTYEILNIILGAFFIGFGIALALGLVK